MATIARDVKRLLLLALALPLAACGAPPEQEPAGGEALGPYEARVLGSGDSLSLAELTAEGPILLNLWATWCAPCRREMPDLQALHERHSGEGLRVVGISLDIGQDDAVQSFLDEVGVSYPNLRDPDGRAATLVRAPGLPATVLLDRDGVVRWRRFGPLQADDADLAAAIAGVLDGSG